MTAKPGKLMLERKHNFGAGPAALPASVLQRAREELYNWRGAGLSVLEISHRSKEFMAAAAAVEADLCALLEVPDDYAVLFLQGGATAQFSAVPLNLAAPGQRVDYVCTGHWSRKAIAEADRLAAVSTVAETISNGGEQIPPEALWQRSDNAAYLHYVGNETIDGVEFHWIPDAGATPLVADMSSTLLSRPLDVRRFGVIYAGAQKNLGPAGITLVIVRRDLLDRARADIPTCLHWRPQADNDSMYNTPPTFAWYMVGLTLQWLQDQGGLAAMAEINRRKADKLYRAIDGSGFYINKVAPGCRSWMNVPFYLAADGLDGLFLEEAANRGLLSLKGHRSVGGMRASLYNAVPEAAVDALIAFLQDFEQRRG